MNHDVNDLRITVIGAGHGGKSMAADMANRGFSVTLYNRTEANIEAIRLRGGIDLTTEDGRDHFCPLANVTCDMAEAVRDADLIMVVIPASGHRWVALNTSSCLRNDQIVLLNPGRTGGALEFAAGLREAGCATRPISSSALT